MRAVVQRVQEAWVRVAAEEVARIGPGLLVLAGVSADDGPADVAYLAQKLAHLRVFAGEGGSCTSPCWIPASNCCWSPSSLSWATAAKAAALRSTRPRPRSWPKNSMQTWPRP